MFVFLSLNYIEDLVYYWEHIYFADNCARYHNLCLIDMVDTSAYRHIHNNHLHIFHSSLHHSPDRFHIPFCRHTHFIMHILYISCHLHRTIIQFPHNSHHRHISYPLNTLRTHISLGRFVHTILVRLHIVHQCYMTDFAHILMVLYCYTLVSRWYILIYGRYVHHYLVVQPLLSYRSSYLLDRRW
jgi:hypothetical protein